MENRFDTEDNVCSDVALNIVNEIYVEAATAALNKKKKTGNGYSNKKNKIWFNHSLQQMKAEVLRLGRMMQREPHVPEIRSAFYKKLKEYSKKRKYESRKFKQVTMSKLDNLRDDNPEEYWKLLQKMKDIKNDPCDNISIKEWESYFRKLNNTESGNTSNPIDDQIINDLAKLEETKVFNEMDFKIKNDEITCAIRKLKNKKD